MPPNKDKIFHPNSRKADQLVRASLRKDRLRASVAHRSHRLQSLVDVYRFYLRCLPNDGVLTLDELHHVVRDVWLARFDDQLSAEQAARRNGRPKSAAHVKLEDLKLREAEQYRTGLEVLDLTHATNVELFRMWDQNEVAYVEQLRFMRISSADTSLASVSRRGKHPMLVADLPETYTASR